MKSDRWAETGDRFFMDIKGKLPGKDGRLLLGRGDIKVPAQLI